MSFATRIILYSLIVFGGMFVLVCLIYSLRAYFRFRGKRLVTCPETRRAAAVDLDARQAARESLFGSPHFRLQDCSRWPERQGCGQECLSQIEQAPEGCLVRNVVTQWYEGKKCAVCGRLIHEVEWLGHKPALLNPEKKTVYWDSIAPEKLPEVFETFGPVCWDCHIAETFRRQHPDLVVDRPIH
jgi:hypothetical protein